MSFRGMEDCRLKVAMYVRVGNKDQVMDTDRKEGIEVDKQAIGFVYDSLGREEHFEEKSGRYTNIAVIWD